MSSYPSGYDSFSSPGTNLSSTPLHSDMHDDMIDAMEAVQAELGLSPSGSDATVAARLDRLDRLGVKARATIATAQTGITTVEDLTNLSVSWSAVSSRLYRITWKFRIIGTAANDLAAVYLTDASNGQADWSLHEIPTVPWLPHDGSPLPAYASVMSIGMHYATGLSGTITRKLRMERHEGSGSLSAYASGTEIGFLVVEDVGAA